MKLLKIGIAVSAVLGVLVQGASAASLTYDIGAPFNDKDPAPTGSVITAKFDDNNEEAGSVTLTLTGGLTESAFATEIYFNSMVAVTGITNTGALAGSSAAYRSNFFKADGDGYFDLMFSFATEEGESRFDTETTVYTLTGTGLTAASFFDVYSAASNEPNAVPSPKGYYVAAHVQGYGNSDSTWLTDYNGSAAGDGGGTVVPIPSSLLLLGSALAGLGIVGRRKHS